MKSKLTQKQLFQNLVDCLNASTPKRAAERLIKQKTMAPSKPFKIRPFSPASARIINNPIKNNKA